MVCLCFYVLQTKNINLTEISPDMDPSQISGSALLSMLAQTDGKEQKATPVSPKRVNAVKPYKVTVKPHDRPWLKDMKKNVTQDTEPALLLSASQQHIERPATSTASLLVSVN